MNNLEGKLKLQNRLLKSVLVSLLFFVPISHINSAEPTLENTLKTAMAEEIKVHTALKIVFQTPELIITPADIIRGYIDIPDAVHAEIQNNNLAGYLIVFEGLGEYFKEAVVKGLGKDTIISSNGGWIAQPYNGKDPVMIELSFRFILSENITPGTYAWPLSISVSPIIPV
ncbi:MAG: hypothetical protein AB1610_01670 [Nitrospirota bacterium]